MESSLVTKNVRIGQHRTSVRLEPEIWDALYEIVRRENISLKEFYERVARNQNGAGGFTSALRVHVFQYYLKRLQDIESDTPMQSTQLPRENRHNQAAS